VGFFGQNFDVLGGQVFFAIMLATIVILPISMVVWFRHKDWI
jgi:magnesium transporter